MPDMYTLFKDCRVSPEIITKYIAYLHKVSFKHIKTFSDYRTRVSVQRISVHDTDGGCEKKRNPVTALTCDTRILLTGRHSEITATKKSPFI